MTTQSARDKLLEDAAAIIREARLENETDDERVAYDVFALVAERLADVTPEMVEAWADTGLGDCPTEIEAATADWRAMLSASALGKGGNDK